MAIAPAPTWSGRNVLVSGGSRGIGRACALAFARAGADVTLQYFRHESDAASVVKAVEAMGRRAWMVSGDAASRDDARRAVRAAEEAMGSIHAVVASAGVDGSGPLGSTSEVSFRRTVEVDLYGPFALVQAAAVPLAASEGSVVLVSSVSGVMAEPRSFDYSSAKAGLFALTRSLAVALAPRVRVNAVAPGTVRTPMTQTLWEDPRRREAVRRTIPLGRWGEAEDVADAVLFLAGPEARFITGATLAVDGGQQHHWTVGAAESPDR